MSVLVLLENVSNVTVRDHDGAVVVVADTEEAARTLLAQTRRLGNEMYQYAKPSLVKVYDMDWSNRQVYELQGDHKPSVQIFPDYRGCGCQ